MNQYITNRYKSSHSIQQQPHSFRNNYNSSLQALNINKKFQFSIELRDQIKQDIHNIDRMDSRRSNIIHVLLNRRKNVLQEITNKNRNIYMRILRQESHYSPNNLNKANIGHNRKVSQHIATSSKKLLNFSRQLLTSIESPLKQRFIRNYTQSANIQQNKKQKLIKIKQQRTIPENSEKQNINEGSFQQRVLKQMLQNSEKKMKREKYNTKKKLKLKDILSIPRDICINL